MIVFGVNEAKNEDMLKVEVRRSHRLTHLDVSQRWSARASFTWPSVTSTPRNIGSTCELHFKLQSFSCIT